MRKRPLRGDKYQIPSMGAVVTVIDTSQKDYVRVILPDGKISSFHKSLLDLPIIDTKAYEKMLDD